MMEICFVPKTEVASQYPGIYLFTGVARLMRPVWNYLHQAREMIGTFEQVYLNICVIPDEFHEGVRISGVACCVSPTSEEFFTFD
jgi:DNA-directed RNA polymerase I subunit RPA2